MTKTMIIDGMHCAHCKASAEKALASVPGVSAATVDLDAKKATIATDGSASDQALTKAIDDAGFTVVSLS